jgi:hypothetical protein
MDLSGIIGYSNIFKTIFLNFLFLTNKLRSNKYKQIIKPMKKMKS